MQIYIYIYIYIIYMNINYMRCLITLKRGIFLKECEPPSDKTMVQRLKIPTQESLSFST